MFESDLVDLTGQLSNLPDSVLGISTPNDLPRLRVERLTA